MRYDFPMVLLVVLERLWMKISAAWYKFRSPVLAWFWGVRYDGHVLFQGKTFIRTRHSGEIVLGRHVLFNSQAVANLVGLMGASILDTRGGGRILIGDDSGFSSVVLSSRSEIRIGKRVKVGGNVRIFDHDFHCLDPKIRFTAADLLNVRTRPVILEDDVFVGTNAIILKGTKIGARSVVAAGSVVFGLQIPPDSLVKGNPAQIIAR